MIVKVKSKKGFSLIEAVVSIAIIGIISISFLSMYTSGFTTISKNGSRSSALFTGQSNIEEKLNGTPGTTSTSLTISIPNSSPISVSGNIITESVTVKGQSVNITAFKASN
jgi:prepilin-type N-terminal cleavage/methylation domain-containing protein